MEIAAERSSGHVARPLRHRIIATGGIFACDNFTASGEVCLTGAQIGDPLNFNGATLTNRDGDALDLTQAQVANVSLLFAEPPDGLVGFSGLSAGRLVDDPRTWPARLRLDHCTYDRLEAQLSEAQGTRSVGARAPVHVRLAWLRRDPDGFSPQPYEQLAACYRRMGHEPEARRVLLAKHRRRRAP